MLFGLAVFGVLALAPPPAARSALADTPDTPAATAAAFALCFAVWGAGLEHIARRPPRILPQPLIAIARAPRCCARLPSFPRVSPLVTGPTQGTASPAGSSKCARYTATLRGSLRLEALTPCSV